ncbi:hypothetical protein CTA2_1013, partial [Colletotrichum tanaceti]
AVTQGTRALSASALLAKKRPGSGPGTNRDLGPRTDLSVSYPCSISPTSGICGTSPDPASHPPNRPLTYTALITFQLIQKRQAPVKSSRSIARLGASELTAMFASITRTVDMVPIHSECKHQKTRPLPPSAIRLFMQIMPLQQADMQPRWATRYGHQGRRAAKPLRNGCWHDAGEVERLAGPSSEFAKLMRHRICRTCFTATASYLGITVLQRARYVMSLDSLPHIRLAILPPVHHDRVGCRFHQISQPTGGGVLPTCEAVRGRRRDEDAEQTPSRARRSRSSPWTMRQRGFDDVAVEQGTGAGLSVFAQTRRLPRNEPKEKGAGNQDAASSES